MTSKCNITGNRLVITRLGELTKKTQTAVVLACEEAADYIYRKVYDYTSLSCHSLADLRKLDHPYSVRHPANTLHSDHLVHTQSGNLLRAIKKEAGLKGNYAIAAVSVDKNQAPYAVYLLSHKEPRKRMRRRDFLSAAWLETKDEAYKIIKYSISSRVGSRGTIR